MSERGGKQKVSTTKVIVNLPDETVESLKCLAEANHTTLTNAFVLAIHRQEFLDREIAQGNILLLEKKPFFPVLFAPNHGATYCRVVFNH